MADVSGFGESTLRPKKDPNCKCLCHKHKGARHIVACC